MNIAKLKRRLRRNREVIRAVWRAFRYRTSIGAPVFREALAFLRRILPFRRARPRSPLKLWLHRVRSCRKCELYDRANRTCGTNRDIIEAGGVLYPNGCSCLVGLKTSDPEQKCFMVTLGAPSNWIVNMLSLDGGGCPDSHWPRERERTGADAGRGGSPVHPGPLQS